RLPNRKMFSPPTTAATAIVGRDTTPRARPSPGRGRWSSSASISRERQPGAIPNPGDHLGIGKSVTAPFEWNPLSCRQWVPPLSLVGGGLGWGVEPAL